jgi:hypothetical protein
MKVNAEQLYLFFNISPAFFYPTLIFLMGSTLSSFLYKTQLNSPCAFSLLRHLGFG